MISALFYDKGLEIKSTEGDLRQFAYEINSCVNICRVLLSPPAKRDNRGILYARSIGLLVKNELVDIVIADEEVVISGSKKNFAVLIQNILWLADNVGPNNSHIHIEYYPDHFFLGKTALPLVVECSTPRSLVA